MGRARAGEGLEGKRVDDAERPTDALARGLATPGPPFGRSGVETSGHRHEAAIDLDVVAWANRGLTTLPYPEHGKIGERETVNGHS